MSESESEGPSLAVDSSRSAMNPLAAHSSNNARSSLMRGEHPVHACAVSTGGLSYIGGSELSSPAVEVGPPAGSCWWCLQSTRNQNGAHVVG